MTAPTPPRTEQETRAGVQARALGPARRRLLDGHQRDRSGLHHPDRDLHGPARRGVRLRDRALGGRGHRRAAQRLAHHRGLRPARPRARQPGAPRGRLPPRRARRAGRPGVQRRQHRRQRPGRRGDVRARPPDRRRAVRPARHRDLREQEGRPGPGPRGDRSRAADDPGHPGHRHHLGPAGRRGTRERRTSGAVQLPGGHHHHRRHRRRLHHLRGRAPDAGLRAHRSRARRARSPAARWSASWSPA